MSGETDYNKALKDGYQSLLDLSGVGAKRATDLYDNGFRSAEDIAGAAIEDLIDIPGMGKERAEKLIDDAKAYIQRKRDETVMENVSEDNAESQEEGISDSEA